MNSDRNALVKCRPHAPVQVEETTFVVHTGDATQLIVNQEVLERLGLHLNRVYRFVSCSTCGLILTDNWHRHPASAHQKRASPNDIATINALLDGVQQPAPLPVDDTPLQGVRTSPALVCACGFASTSQDVRRHHVHDQPRVEWSRGWVQRVTQTAKYRRVRTSQRRGRRAVCAKLITRSPPTAR